jgi:hypothetical protein
MAMVYLHIAKGVLISPGVISIIVLLGNQQLVQGGELSTSTRQLALVLQSPLVLSGSCGSFVAKLRPSLKQRRCCRVVLLSYLRKEREEGSTPLSYLSVLPPTMTTSLLKNSLYLKAIRLLNSHH